MGECAAAAVHNIAFTGNANRELVAREPGVIRGLVHLLGKGITENAKLQAAAALGSVLVVSAQRGGYIVEADKEAQEEGVASGGLQILIHLLKDSVVTHITKEQSVYALRAMVHQYPTHLE